MRGISPYAVRHLLEDGPDSPRPHRRHPGSAPTDAGCGRGGIGPPGNGHGRNRPLEMDMEETAGDMEERGNTPADFIPEEGKSGDTSP